MSKPSEGRAFNPCLIIPFYNHEHAISDVIAQLEPYQIPCILVDDGSSERCAEVLGRLAQQPWVQVLQREHNGGKGAAVMSGFREAWRQGYTHALQIDADGQHDTADVPEFLKRARTATTAVINGEPKYDDSVPKARFYGRYLTHVWVWINTLSTTIGDSMCGFRMYPLAGTMALLEKTTPGSRMDFDTEVLVRLYWDGVEIVSLPTSVRYPADGVSHFDLWKDNLAISGMHARLFCGMLLRLPILLGRKFR